jgi:hypothetical protein
MRKDGETQQPAGELTLASLAGMNFRQRESPMADPNFRKSRSFNDRIRIY